MLRGLRQVLGDQVGVQVGHATVRMAEHLGEQEQVSDTGPEQTMDAWDQNGLRLDVVLRSDGTLRDNYGNTYAPRPDSDLEYDSFVSLSLESDIVVIRKDRRGAPSARWRLR